MFTACWLIYLTFWFATAFTCSVFADAMSNNVSSGSLLRSGLSILMFLGPFWSVISTPIAWLHAWFAKSLTKKVTKSAAMLYSLAIGIVEGCVGAFVVTALIGSSVTRTGVFLSFGIPVGIAYVAASCMCGAFCVSSWGTATEKWQSSDNPSTF